MAVDYYRRDRKGGITPPDLAKTCTFSEHVVRARGRRTQFTSVSLDPETIRDFGDTLYRLLQDGLIQAKHILVEHDSLLAELVRISKEESGKERDLALRAIRRVKTRKEGLVDWRFETGGVARKDLIAWAEGRVDEFFAKVG